MRALTTTVPFHFRFITIRATLLICSQKNSSCLEDPWWACLGRVWSIHPCAPLDNWLEDAKSGRICLPKMVVVALTPPLLHHIHSLHRSVDSPGEHVESKYGWTTLNNHKERSLREDRREVMDLWFELSISTATSLGFGRTSTDEKSLKFSACVQSYTALRTDLFGGTSLHLLQGCHSFWHARKHNDSLWHPSHER